MARPRPSNKKQIIIDLHIDTIIKVEKEIWRLKAGGQKQVTRSQVIDDILKNHLPE